jgi:hypothetical protein
MRLVVLLALFLALACDAAVASTPLKARRLGATSSVIGTDGTRFAAWLTPDLSAAVVFDAHKDAAKAIPNPAGCGASAIGAGALVYTCAGGFPGLGNAWLRDLRTGALTEVVGDPAAFFGTFTGRSFVAVGTKWIQARVTDYHVDVSHFYSRTDGAEYDGRSPFGRHVRPDLDRAQLRTAICSPLDYGVLHAHGIRTARTRTYVVPGHPISAIYRLGKRLLVTTDAVAGTRGVQLRLVSTRSLRSP